MLIAGIGMTGLIFYCSIRYRKNILPTMNKTNA